MQQRERERKDLEKLVERLQSTAKADKEARIVKIQQEKDQHLANLAAINKSFDEMEEASNESLAEARDKLSKHEEQFGTALGGVPDTVR